VEIKIGDSSIDLVAGLALRHSDVRAFYLTAYVPSPALQDRLAGKGGGYTAQIFEKAENYRRIAGPLLPYWESILIASWESEGFREFVREAIRHTSGDSTDKKFEISRKDMTVGKIKTISSSGVEALALSSVCKLQDGSERYIPLMDFRIPPSAENLLKIEVLVKAIGIPGAILRSGKSYHFFGFELLTKDQNLAFLGKCILAAPITDARYIGHRLIDGASDLRITASETKSLLPIVEKICSKQ